MFPPLFPFGIQNLGQQLANPQPEPNMMELMNQLYQPSNQISDLYTQMATNPPQYQQPSRLNRIGGILAGLGAGVKPVSEKWGWSGGFTGDPGLAAETRDKVQNQPYYREANEWLARMKALEPALGAEKSYNIGARQAASDVARHTISERRIAEQERANRAREENLQGRLEISDKRARAYVFRQMNPDYKLVKTAGGNYQWTAPNKPNVDTGIKVGNLNQQEEMELAGELRMQAIDAQNEGRRDIAEMGGAQIMTGADGQAYVVNPRTNTVSPLQGAPSDLMRPGTSRGGRQSSAMLPSQQKIDVFNRAQQLKNTDSELAPFIHLLPGNIVEVDQPSEGWWGSSGPTSEQARRLQEALALPGTSQPQQNTTGQTTQTTPPSEPQIYGGGPPKPGKHDVHLAASKANWVSMVAPNGRSMMVPPEKVAELESRGARRR